jgi:hypothetical protein
MHTYCVTTGIYSREVFRVELKHWYDNITVSIAGTSDTYGKYTLVQTTISGRFVSGVYEIGDAIGKVLKYQGKLYTKDDSITINSKIEGFKIKNKRVFKNKSGAVEYYIYDCV